MRLYSLLLMLILIPLYMTSCETVHVGGPAPAPHPEPPVVKKGGPPDHAPAHGYRRKFQYRYYPSSKVYYSVEKRVYFWLEGNGWKLGASLPAGYSISGVDPVSLSLDEETPYAHYEGTVQSTHPGKGKGKDKNKKFK